MEHKKMKGGIVLTMLVGMAAMSAAPASADTNILGPCGLGVQDIPVGNENYPVGEEAEMMCEAGDANDPDARGCQLRILGAPPTPPLSPEDNRTASQILDLFCTDPAYSVDSVSDPYVTDITLTSDGLMGTGIGNNNPVVQDEVGFTAVPVTIPPLECQGPGCDLLPSSAGVNADAQWIVMVNNLSSYRFRVCVDVVLETTNGDVAATACIQYGQFN